MTIPEGLAHVLVVDPDVLGGEPCFVGTRVPLETVLDNLAGGLSMKHMLESYPSLTEAHVRAVLRWEDSLARDAAGLRQRAG